MAKLRIVFVATVRRVFYETNLIDPAVLQAQVK